MTNPLRSNEERFNKESRARLYREEKQSYQIRGLGREIRIAAGIYGSVAAPPTSPRAHGWTGSFLDREVSSCPLRTIFPIA